jgi:superoxide dismutase, Fe-Mn family
MNEMKPLACDPTKLTGLSEKLIVSHYENNYGGAVKRLNQIQEHLESIDFEKAPGFVINGLKREELIAMNSMILHEIYLSGLGATERNRELSDILTRDFKSVEQWQAQFSAMGKAQGGGVRLGVADLLGSQRQTLQSVGGGPHDDDRRR